MCRLERIKITSAIRPQEDIPRANFFTEKPKGLNSAETLLSRVNLRTKIKFLMSLGACKTFLRVMEGLKGDIGKSP